MTAPAHPHASILVVDDEEVIRDVLAALLDRQGGYDVHLAEGALDAERILASRPIDLVLLDLMLPGVSGLELLRGIRSDDPQREVIMMTAHGSVETAVEAMKAGAFHYLTKPFQNDEVLLLVDSALTRRRLRRENEGLRRALAERHRFARLIGRSRAMQQVYQVIKQVASARTTVLITGESGTGKELTAEAIHQTGVGADSPFLTVNSSNLPQELLESELFGHARGAFTGAVTDKEGLFAAAAGGTLFFDEISTIPLPVQAKLLRVMQEKEFLPLGSVRPVRVDVRILAATNEDLARLVREGQFRDDLYYRLNVLTIALPSLRERREDIPLLAEHFLATFCDEHGRPGLRLSVEALQEFDRYEWPGNVRELRNSIERAVLLTESDIIDVASLPAEIRRHRGGASGAPALPEGKSLQEAVEEYERTLIRWARQQAEGVQRRAAERLQIKPTTLSEKMKRLGIR
ncbi:MAG: sigma-54-dependent Fis family transcriptional regulator [Acidobacteriota bacterium]|nr:MAG: sigma-54-dependent Fis family transcriptional regulator [Acidobacteriota bacterium]